MMRAMPFATTEGEEAVAATTVETLVQLRGVSTIKAEILEVDVSTDYATDGTGIAYWELLYQTTDGTGSGGTEVTRDPDDATALVTAFNSFSAEPTAGSIIDGGHFNNNGGSDHRQWPEGLGPVLDNSTGSRIAIRITSDKACNAAAKIRWKECNP